MDNAEEEVINWVGVKTFDEKMFLKAYFDAMSPEEMTWVRNIAQRYKRGKDKRKPERNVQTPDTPSVQPFLSYIDPSGEIGSINGWWSKCKTVEVLSIDCEMVSVSKGSKYIQQAALVSVCDFKGKEVYKATIKHEKNSFLVNRFTRAINGIEANSLVNWKDLQEVQHDLEELFNKKLIVGHALAGDFDSLGMKSGDYDTFDLQWHWWWEDEFDGSRKPFKLKALYKHYFPDENFQDDVHDPFKDAKAVMRIFRFKYLKGEKTDCFQEKFNQNPVPDGVIDRLLVPKKKRKLEKLDEFRIG